MLNLVFIAIVAWWSIRVGSTVLALCDALPDNRWDRRAIACTIGLGSLAMAALALGEIGRLDRAGLCVVFALGWMASLVVRRPEPTDPRTTLESMSPSWLSRGMDATFAITVVGTLLTALSPATDGDALCYHLQVPKIFLYASAMTYDPDLHETIYPLVTEMLYAVALAFRGPIACKLIQWLLGLCFAGCVTAIARPSLGDRARWAGTIAMLVPAVSNGMSAPLNDVALATFSNAALWAVLLWKHAPSPRRAFLAGMLAGMAIGVKYPALVWVGLLAGFMLLDLRTRRPEGDGLFHVVRDVSMFAVALILTGAWWYLRAYVHTGNPVFPFFRDLFGGAGIDDVLDPIKRPMPVTIPNLVMAIGLMTLQPDRFDSLSHQFGPVFLLMLPGLFLLRPPRRVTAIAILGFTFLTLCLTQRQSMRFVLLALGPFSVAAAWVASSWWQRGRRPGRVLVVGLVVMLAAESVLSIGRARHGMGVVLGRETEAHFLDRREPSYRVGQWIGANLPASARLIGQDHRGFYIPRPYVMELAHRRRTGLGSGSSSPEDIIAQMREEGFTHLMLCPPVPETAVEFDPTLSNKLAPWLRARAPLFRESITDPDGVVREYAIHDLSAEASLPSVVVRR